MPSEKTRDYVKEIHELNQAHVYVKYPEKVNNIIENFIIGGYDKLQVVSDFDKTITKQHENGKIHLSSFGMFTKCPSVTKEHIETTSVLAKKYVPLENDPTISYEEKRKHMEDWWSLSEKSLRGLKVSPKEIEDVCIELSPSVREHTKEFFDELNKSGIPVLVFSAGLGDMVVAMLKHCGVLLPNVEVISNFLKFNEEGTIEGFNNKIIHVYNKNEYAIKGSSFYTKILDRDNVILLGDNIGDAKMAEGIDHLRSVLKIGFLYERIEESLPTYMETFDIVLVDDQTMDVPGAIFSLIEDSVAKKTDVGN